MRDRGYEIAAIETTVHAVDLFDWAPRFPVCIVFGHEVEGIRREVSEMCDTHVRIPMLGSKHSLNVATAGGVLMYELLRKYRNPGTDRAFSNFTIGSRPGMRAGHGGQSPGQSTQDAGPGECETS
jgi:tRNA C32,U32 (ribose-2'-O)-methylase TrmJ